MSRKVYEAELLKPRTGGASAASGALAIGTLTALGPPAFEAIEKVVTSAVLARRDVEMLRAQTESELAKMELDAKEATDIRQKEADVVRQKVESYTQLAQDAMREGTPEQFDAVLKALQEVGS